MKRIITMLLAVVLIASALSVPAFAASPGWDWADYFARWKAWITQVQEAESPAEAEATGAPVETGAPEEPEQAEEKYTIQYDANGGIWWSLNSSPATKNIKYVYVQAGDSTKTLSAPTRGGYAFRGWQAANGTVYAVQEEFTPDCDMELKAVWECTLD